MNLSPKFNTLPQFEGRIGASSFPFEVSVVQDNIVSVNAYSAILNDLTTRAHVPIIGTDIEFQINYGQKIYLEIYFDKVMNPVLALVTADGTWRNAYTQKTKIDGSIEKQPTYPNELEFISKADFQIKLTELNDRKKVIEEYFQDASAANDSKKAKNEISEVEWQAKKDWLANFQASYVKIMFPYISKFNQFFETGATAQKKLFRAFKMIAYTTRDMKSNLVGQIVVPAIDTRQQSFKLVQCVNTDLMLVDYCYKNLPCKISIPWSRPVFEYKITTNITEDNQNYDAET